MAITKSEAPTLVNLPKPPMANGQMEGYIKELHSPSSTTNSTDIYPSVKSARRVKIIPAAAEYFKAVFWLKYLGIQIMPIK